VKRITGDEPPPPVPAADRRVPPPPRRDERTEERAAEAPPRQPALLEAARDGRGDDLTLLKGVGAALAARLNETGIWHYDQIADWGPGEVEWVERTIEARGDRSSAMDGSSRRAIWPKRA
jgi:NADH-quinone oxidoreductase subunit E